MYLLISFRLAQPLSSISLAISKWLCSFPLYFFLFVFKSLLYNFWARIRIVVIVGPWERHLNDYYEDACVLRVKTCLSWEMWVPCARSSNLCLRSCTWLLSIKWNLFVSQSNLFGHQCYLLFAVFWRMKMSRFSHRINRNLRQDSLLQDNPKI